MGGFSVNGSANVMHRDAMRAQASHDSFADQFIVFYQQYPHLNPDSLQPRAHMLGQNFSAKNGRRLDFRSFRACFPFFSFS